MRPVDLGMFDRNEKTELKMKHKIMNTYQNNQYTNFLIIYTNKSKIYLKNPIISYSFNRIIFQRLIDYCFYLKFTQFGIDGILI